MRLLLLRHGKTLANIRRLYCGVSDLPLSEEGRNELAVLRETLQYPDLTGMQIITSGMKRADESLQILFGRAQDVRMPAFREMDFGSFEMHSYDELKDDPAYQAWIMDETGESCTPGGESAAQFRTRVIAAGDALCDDALILCHGGVISALMQHWFPGEGKNMYQWQPGFGMGYLVEFQEGIKEYHSIG